MFQNEINRNSKFNELIQLKTLFLPNLQASWISVRDLEEDFLEKDSTFDLAIVRACRTLLAVYLVENRGVELNGISVEKAILASHDDCHDIHTYCR